MSFNPRGSAVRRTGSVRQAGPRPAGERRSPAARAHRTMLPFAVSVTAASAVLQLSIIATGNRITLLSVLLLVTIAAGYAAYVLVYGRPLSQVRYGLFTVHTIAYAAINTGFLIHAYALLVAQSPAIAGDGPLAISSDWMGATFSMAGCWGLGLLVHGIGATLSRGFERTRA